MTNPKEKMMPIAFSTPTTCPGINMPQDPLGPTSNWFLNPAGVTHIKMCCWVNRCHLPRMHLGIRVFLQKFLHGERKASETRILTMFLGMRILRDMTAFASTYLARTVSRRTIAGLVSWTLCSGLILRAWRWNSSLGGSFRTGFRN